MSLAPIARGAKTRAINKSKRRDHILACAGQIVIDKGYECLTLAEIAKSAGVTIPTIHNLLGKKSQIFDSLIEEMVTRLGIVLSHQPKGDPLLAMEAFLNEIIALFQTNEALYKAAFIAGEKTNQFDRTSQQGIFAKSLKLTTTICTDGQKNGYLHGHIKPAVLGQQIFGCHRLARQDWMQGHIGLQAYQTQVLLGTSILLYSDAASEFRQRLNKKIKEITK